jgi:hypothetical protein
MVDIVDYLLNNVVDLYVQAVGYRQIPTPVCAGIRQIMQKFGDVRQPPSDSGGSVPDSSQAGRSGQISGYQAGILARSLAIRPAQF